MIQITKSIAIDESELQENFMRSSGAGGQNVQKVETAVQLRFNVRNSPNLPPLVRARLEKLAGRRRTKAGVLIINAQRHRTLCGGRSVGRPYRDRQARLSGVTTSVEVRGVAGDHFALRPLVLASVAGSGIGVAGGRCQ